MAVKINKIGITGFLMSLLGFVGLIVTSIAANLNDQGHIADIGLVFTLLSLPGFLLCIFFRIFYGQNKLIFIGALIGAFVSFYISTILIPYIRFVNILVFNF